MLNSIFSSTVLTSIGSNLAKIISKGLIGIASTLGQPFLAVYYIIGFWMPLQVIAAMTALFKFFASGFTAIIFGAETNPDGSIKLNMNNLTFNWSTNLGYIITFFFVVALTLFFINFLFNFSTNTVVDSEGKPTKMQSRRFTYLKWPLWMIILLIFTPGFLSIVDAFITLVLRAFDTTGVSVSVSQSDINNLKTFMWGEQSSTYYAQLKLALSAETFGSGTSAMAGSFRIFLTNYAAKITDLNRAILSRPTAGENNSSEYYETINLAISDAKSMIDKITAYIDNGLRNDYNRVLGIVNSLQPSSYINKAQSEILTDVGNNLITFRSNLTKLDKTFSYFDGSDSDVNQELYNLRIILNTYNSGSYQYRGTIDPCLAHINAYHAEITNTSSLFYTHLSEKASAYSNTLLAGDKIHGYVGVYELSSRTSGTGLDFNIAKYAYGFITGDDNLYAWNKFPPLFQSSIATEMTLPQYYLGLWCCWGTVMIVYQYLQAVITRTFYIFCYWVIGWLYLANAIKDPKPAMGWYKQLIGKWLSVIVLFTLFSLTCIMLPLLRDPIERGLNQQQFKVKGFDIPIVSYYGLMLVLEGLLQMGYTVAGGVQQDLWDIKDEKFASARSSILTEGKAMSAGVQKAVSSVGSFAFDAITAKPLRSAATAVIDEHQYWRGRYDDKLLYGMLKQTEQDRQDTFLKDQEEARKHGFDLQRKKNGEYFQKPINSSKKAQEVNQDWVEKNAQQPKKEETQDEKLKKQLKLRYGAEDRSVKDLQFSPYATPDKLDKIDDSLAAQKNAQAKLSRNEQLTEEDHAALKGPTAAEAYHEKATLENFMRLQYHSDNINEQEYSQAADRLKNINSYIDDKIHTNESTGIKSEFKQNDSWVSNVYTDFSSHDKFMDAAKQKGHFQQSSENNN